MKPTSATAPPRSASPESLRGIPYENTTAAKPPIPITVATATPRDPSHAIARLRRPQTTEPPPLIKTRSHIQDDRRRDSGLAPSSLANRDSRTTIATDADSIRSMRHSSSHPILLTNEDPPKPGSPLTNEQTDPRSESNDQLELSPNTQGPFMGILTEIPTGSFEDLTLPGKVEFSKRGSMLIGGKKANERGRSNGRLIGSRRQPKASNISLSPAVNVPTRMLSADDEALSLKVRSMYEDGGQGGDAGLDCSNATGNGMKAEDNATVGTPPRKVVGHLKPTMNGNANHDVVSESPSATNRRINRILRGETELAGGIEDWDNVDGEDVDRYGFILPKRTSKAGSMISHQTNAPEPPRLQRMSTLLQLASEAPRRGRSRNGQRTLSKSPARSTSGVSTTKPHSTIIRPTSSQSSYRTTKSSTSRMRSATNRFPHNKDRRCVDEAGDMLTLPPGLEDIAEGGENGRAADDVKRREWEREDKWRKMAKIVKNDKHGGGMVFEFDTKSPKLIERTWKGIPDRWRATAWHAFLTASAKKRQGSPSEEELIAAFHQLLDQSSPDDVQIDIDVPRTINSHIMFRRRYRGGQRLLFRVLHCMSIYFPDTGYVQGMAALVATLLCYFDEEMAFVMLVRLWQLRGLERLYQSGFEGLMQALEEFEKDWLGSKKDVAAKLTDLNIPATSYGTRWYLTLFNYSIPFPAQLRIWDVFMLLGDPHTPLPPITPLPPPSPNLHPPTSSPYLQPPPSSHSQLPPPSTPTSQTQPPIPPFNSTLDILHACALALIDGTRDILLDSDFENAMKVLTSWIPVKDEEMLMRVARVEWKMKKRGRR